MIHAKEKPGFLLVISTRVCLTEKNPPLHLLSLLNPITSLPTPCGESKLDQLNHNCSEWALGSTESSVQRRHVSPEWSVRVSSVPRNEATLKETWVHTAVQSFQSVTK